MSQVHCSGTKSSAITIMAHSSKLTLLALVNLLWTNWKEGRSPVLGFEKGGILEPEKNYKWKNFFHVSSPLQWYKKFRAHNNSSLQQVRASSIGKSTVDELKKKNGVLILRIWKRGSFGCWKKFFHVPSPLQWYKKFRTHNKGSLQQNWASSVGKSTVDELKKEKWRSPVLGFEKGGILAAIKIINERIFSCLKSTAVVPKVPQ